MRLALSGFDYWTGASGIDSNWMTPGNWEGDVAPSAGDALVFQASPTSLTAVNNFPTGTNFVFIDIAASGYALSGNALSLTVGIETTFGSGSATDSIPTEMLGTTSPTPTPTPSEASIQSGSQLTLSGVISGTTGLAVGDSGTLVLSAVNDYTGTTTVSGTGTTLLLNNGTIGPVQINTGTTLGGYGTVGNVTSVGGTINPGNPSLSNPAILNTGSLLLDSNSKVVAQLNGTTAGTQYDQIVASGNVTLGQATLDYSVGYSPANGDHLTIIDNNSGNAVSGTFANLVQGASLIGYPLEITYFGGVSNQSVELNGLTAPSLNVSGLASSVYGQTDTFTAQVSGNSGTPTGTVAFYNGAPNAGGTQLGTGTISFTGVASFTTANSLSVANSPYNIYAVYLPDSSSSYGSTTSLQPLVLTITPAPLTITATAESTVYGQAIPSPLPVTYTGFVNGDSASSLTVAPTATTTATSTSSPGTYPITVSGAVDPNYTFTYASGNLIISQASTTTTVTPPTTAISAGGSTTFTAQVTPVSPGSGTPTGTVYFLFSNGEEVPFTLTSADNGKATVTVSNLSTGTTSVIAYYTGDGLDFAASLSSQSSFIVGPGIASASVLTLPIRNARGQLVAIDVVAEITPLSASETPPTPTGQVSFLVGVRNRFIETLDNGVATLRLPAARVLRHFLYVRYSGDANYQATLSLAEVVNNASLRTAEATAKSEHHATDARVPSRTPFARATSLNHDALRKHRHA